MSISFSTKYPASLKNAAWQKKKSFKDKNKTTTKTGLGAMLVKAEAAWGKIQFDKLIAAKQHLQGKNVAEVEKAARAARLYLYGPAVQQTISALDAAASRARLTGGNTELSSKAAEAAKQLAGELINQAKLLRDIRLDDFVPDDDLKEKIGENEKKHTGYLHSMDGILHELRSAKSRENWNGQPINEVVNNAVKVSGALATATGDPHWTATNNLWRQIYAGYTTSNQLIDTLPDSRSEDEIDKFIDLAQQKLGNVWH